MARRRQQVRRGGFARKQDAIDAMQSELVDRRRGTHVERNGLTFGEYARSWLTDRADARVRPGRLAEITYAISSGTFATTCSLRWPTSRSNSWMEPR